jgi:hypothetical protein
MFDTWRCVARDRCMARNDTPIYRSVFFGRVPQWLCRTLGKHLHP